eukprot:1185294-Prorocentrum_minimum.AAC.2
MAVCRQGMYAEYSLMEYSKCRALNGILVSTVDDCRLGPRLGPDPLKACVLSGWFQKYIQKQGVRKW